jgi:hypothetical protein
MKAYNTTFKLVGLAAHHIAHLYLFVFPDIDVGDEVLPYAQIFVLPEPRDATGQLVFPHPPPHTRVAQS